MILDIKNIILSIFIYVLVVLPPTFVSSQTNATVSSQTNTNVSNNPGDTAQSTHQPINSSTHFKIDSLKQLLANAKANTTKINLLRQIGIAYHGSKESLPYFIQALELSQKIKNTSALLRTGSKLEADCYNDIGIVRCRRLYCTKLSIIV